MTPTAGTEPVRVSVDLSEAARATTVDLPASTASVDRTVELPGNDAAAPGAEPSESEESLSASGERALTRDDETSP